MSIAQVVMMQYGVLGIVILRCAQNDNAENSVLHHNDLPGKFLSAAKNVKERQKKKHKRHHQMKHYYVYILANRYKTLYTGVTNNLLRRLDEHKQHIAGFTSKYDVTRLVYFEETSDVHVALEREKCIKGWLRTKKVALIETGNPDWRDLSEEWEGG